MDDMIIIGLYIFFNLVIWFKMKDKRFRWSNEILIRAATPIGIAVAWAYFFKSYEIFAILFIALILSYALNFSEVFLREHYTSVGERLVILSFYNVEARYNTLNVYIDTSHGSIDLKRRFEDNLAYLDEKEQAEARKLIEPLEQFHLDELYICWLDFLKENFARYLKIYRLYIPNEEVHDEAISTKTRERTITKIKETIIPRVMHLHCAQLKPEEIFGRKIPVVYSVEAPYNEKLQLAVEKYSNAMENVKGFPKWWEERFKDEKILSLEGTIEDMFEELVKLRRFKKEYADKLKRVENE